jgi:cytochrome c553
MKKALFILLCVVVFASLAMAQVTYTLGTGKPIGATSPIDKLGAHENGGRGCVGCHAPHSGVGGNGGNVGTGTVVDTTNAGNDALWGQDLGPLYGATLNMGDNGQYKTTLPASTAFAVADEEIRGIMMCLSCHDGNIAKGAMMVNQSWEQRAGLLPATYGSKPIPTLLGNDGTTAGNYNNDHPVGPQATLGAVGVASRFVVTGGKYSTTDAQYLEFINNYGAPTFFGRTPPVLPTGFVDGSAPTNAYVVCTTCHTPHTMYTSTASASNKIAGLSAGTFPSFFFIAAPYNPSAQPTPAQASSATQFCRQCHFTGAGGSNEGSNIHGVTTAF